MCQFQHQRDWWTQTRRWAITFCTLCCSCCTGRWQITVGSCPTTSPSSTTMPCRAWLRRHSCSRFVKNFRLFILSINWMTFCAAERAVSLHVRGCGRGAWSGHQVPVPWTNQASPSCVSTYSLLWCFHKVLLISTCNLPTPWIQTWKTNSF